MSVPPDAMGAPSEFHGSERDYTHSIGEFAVTKKLPPLLRLHIGDELSAATDTSVVNDTFGVLASAFEAATGWSLDQQLDFYDEDSNQRQRLTIQAANADKALTADAAIEPFAIERWRAEQLAEAISGLYGRLDTLQGAMWRREAELAVGVPVAPRRQQEEHLAARLEVMLRNGAEAAGCCAAGLYLLNDATTELKLRACWGLSKDRLLEPARPLAGAFAELEALLGHVVVLEDINVLPHWETPEPFPAAICLPVNSPTDPLGTIWFFADAVRDFTDQEIHLAEVIAGSIAAELQREVLLGECLVSKQANRQIVHAAQWQNDHLPTVKPMLDDWDMAGWSAAEDELARGFYDWFIPPDGSLAVVVGTCEGLQVESALSAGALQASVRAHAEYTHGTAKTMARVNETMWNSSAGGHEASLFYCKATPGSGSLEYSAAGDVCAILVQRSNIELIPSDSLRLGVLPELNPETAQHHLAAGDVLLIMSTASDRPSQQLEISRQLRAHRAATADELLQFVRSLDPRADLVLILQRREA